MHFPYFLWWYGYNCTLICTSLITNPMPNQENALQMMQRDSLRTNQGDLPFSLHFYVAADTKYVTIY